jgi:hypothetical protein
MHVYRDAPLAKKVREQRSPTSETSLTVTPDCRTHRLFVVAKVERSAESAITVRVATSHEPHLVACANDDGHLSNRIEPKPAN